MSDPRIGDWMQTYTGKAFWPLDPQADEIDPADVAHALAMMCRYGGHTRRFYSVAEHSVLMSEVVAPEHALWALLHDATEAYLVDLPRPIKQNMPIYQRTEELLMKQIALRFGIPETEPAEVKDADNRILLTERAALLGPVPRLWAPWLEALEPLPVKIEGWDPQMAEFIFFDRLQELTS